MANILVFGGTTEGRLIAEYLEAKKQKAYICVATEYGREVLRKTVYCKVLVGRKTPEEMAELIQKHQIGLILDATHPYAMEVSKNIKQVAKKYGITYYRVLRNLGDKINEALYFSSLTEIREYLNSHQGNFVSTLGYKELIELKDIQGLYKRGFVRILPSSNEVELGRLCEAIGFCKGHVIEAKGPFTIEDNEALFRQCKAQFCLTKETGKEGGFPEKVIAAKNVGVQLLVLEHPKEAEGITLQECFKLILYV